MSQSNERSAEWLRIAMEAMEVYRETHETWEEMYARYERLLTAAEAREAGENAAEISADRAWIDGAKFGWNCETKTDLHEAIANRQLQIREAVVKCPRCDSPDPSLHPAMQLEGEVQPCGDLWHTPATEVIHGDSLSTTVEKLREACSGVRVKPEPNSPTAAEELEAAKHETEQVTALYDEAHEKLTIAEGEIARLNDLLQKAEPTAAQVIGACEKALHHERQGLQNLIDFRGFWFGGERRYGALTMEELTEAMVRMEAVSALCARWKEANGGN